MTEAPKPPRDRFAGETPTPMTISIDKGPEPRGPIVRVTMRGDAEPVQAQPDLVDHVRQALRALETLKANLPELPGLPQSNPAKS